MFSNVPDNDKGRRPLIFDGNNRQMLLQIRDSLSHHLRNDDCDIGQQRPETQQPTTQVLTEKGNSKTMTRTGYNKKTMAEIRDFLHHYETTNSSGSTSRQSAGNDVTENIHHPKHFVNQSAPLSEEEERVYKVLGKNKQLTAREVMKLVNDPSGRNGYSKGIRRKQSFESKYGPGSSDTSSVRSDSPNTSSTSQSRPLILDSRTNANMTVNGHQSPPPLPPRRPIIPSATTPQMETPPSTMEQIPTSDQQNLLMVNQNCVPPGHVQQLIQRIQPQPATQIVHPQVVQGQIIDHNSQHNGLTTQAAASPLLAGHQPVVVHSNQRQNCLNSPHDVVTISPNNEIVNNGNYRTTSPAVTIKYTSPSSSLHPSLHPQQQRIQPPPLCISAQNQDNSNLVSAQVPEYNSFEQSRLLVQNSPAALGPDSVQISLPRRTQASPPIPATVAMQIRNMRQPPIMVQSVKSREVPKPVLQTATAPVIAQGGSQSTQNYISSVRTHVNPSQAPPTPGPVHPSRNLQIEIMQHPNNQNVQPHATKTMHAQSKVQIQFQSANPHIKSLQIQNIGGRDYYQKAFSETPTSTPRSVSPVSISRGPNQSPLSMLSTTSSPSTNSDIPDKPPPPYPGRNHQSHFNQCQAQPPLPPRAPINQHIQTTIIQQSTNPHAQCTAINVFPQQTTQRPPPPPPPVMEEDQLKKLSLSSSNGDDTDCDTQSEVPSENSGVSSSHEKHCCTSPIPERKPEKEKLRSETKVRNYSPEAYKFYMEQHMENVTKFHDERQKRKNQLEVEMEKSQLSDQAKSQMRRMLHQKESNYNRLKRAKMDKSMFKKIAVLGTGAFGEVALCRKKDGGQLYAMKTLQKNDVVNRNQIAHVKAERDILSEADHEWVVKLFYSFQDKDNLYFVMAYIPGGDLMGLLIRKSIFEEPLAKFYIAELVSAIESVHRMGFIHRDIKPDNILIDRDGHIKLTDFGLCTGFRWTHNSKLYQTNNKDGTHVRMDSMELGCLEEECNCETHKPLERRRHRDKQRCLAHSLVGTPNYIAPEVLQRSGYTACCDWWSVGVILYEMLVGAPPFYADKPIETQTKVIQWRETLHIPPAINLSEAAIDLILSLLCGPEERLGKNGANEIKIHPFFSEIKFENLRKQKALYVPEITHATDISNFDPPEVDKFDSDDDYKCSETPENGKHPEHAFLEFTFRRFFDDGGHPYPKIKDPDLAVYV